MTSKHELPHRHAVDHVTGCGKRVLCPDRVTVEGQDTAQERPKCVARPAFSASIPPTALTEYTARMITAAILITN